jgi:hypothetical protein
VVPPVGIRGRKGPAGVSVPGVSCRISNVNTVLLQVPGDQYLKFILYDQAGNRTGIMADGHFSAGEHTLVMPEGLKTGIYYISCTGTDHRLYKIVLLK